MGSYLEDYLQSISSLPADLERNFALMRELDSRTVSLVDQVNKWQQAYHPKAREAYAQGAAPSEAEAERILAALEQCLELAAEKVDVAMQTYELTDTHVRRLDDDLRAFETQLELPIVHGHTSSQSRKRRKNNDRSERGNKKQKRGSSSRESGYHRGVQLYHEQQPGANPVVAQAVPVNPSEPLYCVCRGPSAGAMVACDNEQCAIEWFHLGCVGLTQPPAENAKWYCPDCTRNGFS